MMTGSEILTMAIAPMALLLVGFLFWMDFRTQSADRKARRRKRRELRLRSRIRSRVWQSLLNLRNTRRLTDQRSADPEQRQHK